MNEEDIEEIIEFLNEHLDLLKNNNFDELLSDEEGYVYLGAFLYDKLGIKFWKYMTCVPEYMLESSEKLEHIRLPDGITKIAYRAFAYCLSLKSLAIPTSVTEIGDWVFSNCTSLESIIIPDSVTKIGPDAFYKCPKLIIRAPKNSYAIAYAKENNIKYEEI